MVRGVNKNVIEISDTGNDCFERAILFVRPDSADCDADSLRRRATSYLSGIRANPRLFSRGKLASAVKLLASAAGGAAITALLLLL